MKNFTFILTAFILFSCAPEATEENTMDLSEQDSLPTQSLEGNAIEDSASISEELAVQENALTLDDFPSKWFKLTEHNQDYVIYKYCEAETQQLWLEQRDGAWYVTVLYGQDSQEYKVIGFDAYEEEREKHQIMYGTFILESPSNPDMDPELYEFTWNKDAMFCDFLGFFQDETMMVSEQNKENYEFVKEECDYE